MGLRGLASYPNSRIKTRAPTRVEDEFKMYVAAQNDAGGANLPAIGDEAGRVVTANGNAEVAPVDPNRTYVLIRNLSLVPVHYKNEDNADIKTNGNVLKPNDAKELAQTEQAIFVVSDDDTRPIIDVSFGQG